MSGIRRHRIFGLAATLSVIATLLPVVGARADACSDVEMIWARGTGTGLGAGAFSRFDGALALRIDASTSYTSAHELGSGDGFGGFKYLAAGADIDLVLQGLAPFLPGGVYDNSVTEGRHELVAYLEDRAAACPGEVFVLGGHSQGAQVVGEAVGLLDSAVRARVAYVALFGDPKFNTGNFTTDVFPGLPSVTVPIACATGPKPWVRGSAPCFISGGIFGPREPYVPADIEQRVGSWCRNFDPSCDGSVVDLLSLSEHSKYFDAKSDVDFAALEAAIALRSALPNHEADFDVSWFPFAVGISGADLGIVFDTTGSMWPYIDDAKANAADLAQTWTNTLPNARVGLVDYKDQGDAYVSQLDLDLTDSTGDFQTAVDGLSADGGGDTPEAALSGLMTALNGLDWRPGATKVLVVITDAPGKDPEPGTGYTMPQVIQRSLEIDPVAIYTVNVGDDGDVSTFFTPLADGTAGEMVDLQPGQTLSEALYGLFDTVALSPVANLNGPYLANVGQAITFDTYPSFDPDGDLVSFEWDFDGDGITDQVTNEGTVQHAYQSEFHGIASVRVVSSDTGSALATAQVDVGSVGLGNELPVEPDSATAVETAPDEVTVSWVPTADDRADGYKVYLADGTLVGVKLASDPHSVAVTGVDLGQPTQFQVVAVNQFGNSGGVVTPPVGGATSWSPAVRVNDDATTTSQVYPAVRLGPSGAAIAVWQDYRASPPGNPFGAYDIYSSRWDPSTQTWGTNTQVNDVTAPEQYSPSVAVDPNNNAYAVWVDSRNNRSDIYFSKRSATTGAWSANVRVNSSTKFNYQEQPEIATAPNGDAIAIWFRKNNNKLDLWTARLPAGATNWGPEMRVTDDHTVAKQQPRITFGPDGTAYAVWMYPTGGDMDIWFASLPAGSSTWSANAKVSDDPGTAFQSSPDIGVDGAGNVMVVWSDDRSDPQQLRVRRRPVGSAWLPSSVIAAGGGNSPSIAVRSDGRAYAAWHDGDFSTEYPRLWGAGYDPGASTWSSPERIDTNGPDHGAARAAVAIDASQLIVLWQNALNVPSGNNDDDILARVRAP
jgi:Cutinase/von Willebrand factor type A domain/PKD domain